MTSLLPSIPSLDPRIALALSDLDLWVFVWPLVLGLGLYLLLTAQPIGKPLPDLGERLKRLDADERILQNVRRETVKPIFASRLLEALLRPVLDDLGSLLRSVLSRFGLGGGRELIGSPSSPLAASSSRASRRSRRWC